MNNKMAKNEVSLIVLYETKSCKKLLSRTERREILVTYLKGEKISHHEVVQNRFPFRRQQAVEKGTDLHTMRDIGGNSVTEEISGRLCTGSPERRFRRFWAATTRWRFLGFCTYQ